jgi:hypothetical protein
MMQQGCIDEFDKKRWNIVAGEQGILVAKGRLSNTVQADPMFLPRRRALELLIAHYHTAWMHGGVTLVLANLRKRFWFSSGRRAVKSVIDRCLRCKIHNAKPFLLPLFPPLPKERVRQSRIFAHVGLDYLGPVLYRTEGKEKKGWLLLFTCLATRGMILEITPSMEAIAFLQALRRFVSLFGVPDSLLSDNAAQLRPSAARGECRREKSRVEVYHSLIPLGRGSV